MIDSHAHTDFKEFDDDREEVIKRFFEGGGEKIINVGCDLKSSVRSYELAKNNENIFASAGIHPHDADTVDKNSLRKIEELVQHYKVIAVGEIGLDYFRNLSPQEKQIEAFRLQLELADNHKMPLIIHCRDAYNDLIDILKSYQTNSWRGVIHCFGGSQKIAEEFLELGFYIGFTGTITYYKDKSKLGNEPEIYRVIKNMPLNKILIETDCPYLAPVPERGKRNEPLFVRYVAEKVAHIRNVDFKEIEKATSENAIRLFNLEK
ncbi:MAG: TatD family hydrolase [Candidatus Pacebacteria bacterium]|nr:TatD family hydrolase [Candidatus Paceibacterota bacterium]